MPQKPQSSIMLLMIIMAIVMGIGGFLAVSYLSNRPDAPETAVSGNTFPQTVNGVEVQVQLNPDRTVEILGPAAAPAPDTQPQDGGAVEPQPTPPLELVSPTPPPPPTATFIPPTLTPVPTAVIFEQYVVQQNDSLYEIARRTDTSIALMAQHGLSNEDLVPGTSISLPIGNPAYCPGYRPYAVGEGDTAFSIGRKFNISAERLQEINGLDANFTVRVAEILCVP